MNQYQLKVKEKLKNDLEFTEYSFDLDDHSYYISSIFHDFLDDEEYQALIFSSLIKLFPKVIKKEKFYYLDDNSKRSFLKIYIDNLHYLRFVVNYNIPLIFKNKLTSLIKELEILNKTKINQYHKDKDEALHFLYKTLRQLHKLFIGLEFPEYMNYICSDCYIDTYDLHYLRYGKHVAEIL